MASADVAAMSKADTGLGLGLSDANSARSPDLEVSFTHKGASYTAILPHTSSIQDLAAYIDQNLSLPIPHQKLLISPKPGMLRAPFPATPLAPILSPPNGRTPKITLLGSTPLEISTLNASIALANRRNQRDFSSAPAKPVAAYRRAPTIQDLQSSTTYTFLQLRPLAHLPRPERSLAFLERLRDDPGIRASMAKHKWSVPLLTEMDPAEHTTHESRTLGLNRNQGEVIELRLRTDAYDGYRDYKTIRNTLCHELAHNVHGEHDRNFWDLCHQIEREVGRADWKSGGHRLTDHDVYEPGPSSSGAVRADEEGMVADHGAWTGGEYVLGGGLRSATSASSSTSAVNRAGAGAGAGLSRREILAEAAEMRAQQQRRGHRQQQQQQQKQTEQPGQAPPE